MQCCAVKPSKPAAVHKIVLAPVDIAVRCKLYWSPAFCLVVPGRLVFREVVRAATDLVTACPVIAGR